MVTKSKRLTNTPQVDDDYLPMIEATPFRADCEAGQLQLPKARPCSLEPNVARQGWVTPDTCDEPGVYLCQQHRYPSAAQCDDLADVCERTAAGIEQSARNTDSECDQVWLLSRVRWLRDRADQHRCARRDGRTFDIDE